MTVWTLETPNQEYAIEDLSPIIDRSFKFEGVSERAYLRKLWGGESWPSIKKKLMADGSTWYVWYMDGVNRHLANLIKEE